MISTIPSPDIRYNCININKIPLPNDREIYEFYKKSTLYSATHFLGKFPEYIYNNAQTQLNLAYGVNKIMHSKNKSFGDQVEFTLETDLINLLALQPDNLLVYEALRIVDFFSKDTKEHKALKLLWHYLLGGSPNVLINTGELLEGNKAILNRLVAYLNRIKVKGEKKFIGPTKFEFDKAKINIEPVYSMPEWRWAIGGTHFSFKLIDNHTFIVYLNKDWYFKEFLNYDELRPDHSIHNAMHRAISYGAKNFTVFGTDYKIEVE